MVITGVSMDKGDDCGKAVFFERDTFNRVYELPIEGAVSGGWEKWCQRQQFCVKRIDFVLVVTMCCLFLCLLRSVLGEG